MFSLLLKTLRSQNLIPDMSETERMALEAGDVWIDAELFSGRPDFKRMLRETYPKLTEAEQAFMDGPVEEVCRLASQGEVSAADFSRDPRSVVPEGVWDLLCKHRFFGLALPEKYGGHDFSALAQSAIFGKLATSSLGLSSIVLIPNSVGPGELLVEVGTEEQRDYFLPRLARGAEVPCFALTEPTAGSDAASLTSSGVLFKDKSGDLKIKINFEKRYITLAPIATLVGLAFRLEDPENLLGKGEDVGITCALVDASLPGVEIGERHDPMGIAFPNGPLRGRDVIIPADRIIGGIDYAGRGWQMLMDALSGGRAISLPAQSAAGARYAARVAGAYSVVREQFGLSIGRFEGVEEPLARIAALSYLSEAARVFTCGAVDSGQRPAVVSAFMKYNSTELGRRLVIDAMDILGGAAICRGPRNLVADGYTASPIGITVEGANILTRTLIVFGQGALRCHPHAHALLESVREGDAKTFRRKLVAQTFHVLANGCRSFFHSLTRGLFAGSPVGGPTAKYYRRLGWASARFAFYSDLAMALVGGRLKFRGKLTGRFADMLSWMYLGFAALRRWEAEGRRQEDLPLVRWAVEHSLTRVQESFTGILANLGGPLNFWLAGPALAWARLNPMGREPADSLGAEVAAILRQPGEQRDRLTSDLFLGIDEENQALPVLERAFRLVMETAPLRDKLRRAVRKGELPKLPLSELAPTAAAAGVLTDDEADKLAEAEAARSEAIQVDAFPLVSAETAQPAMVGEETTAITRSEPVLV